MAIGVGTLYRHAKDAYEVTQFKIVNLLVRG